MAQSVTSTQPIGPAAGIFIDSKLLRELQPTFENIDRAATVSFRPRGLARGVIARLYEKAVGTIPISLEIVIDLLVRRGQKVGILTGAAVPDFLPNGENDGPLGALVLGRALRQLGYDVQFLTEAELTRIFVGLFELYGDDFPIIHLSKDDPEDHRHTAPELDILIAIEKLGSNKKHIMHGATGMSREGTRAHVDGLVRRMYEDDKLTIGIGDGGNEIGFGKIYEYAREVVDFGRQCKCPCGDGIITTTTTRHLFPVAVSNWGAYALVAGLAAATGEFGIIHTPERELEILALSKKLDCRDGAGGRALESVDGVPAPTSAAMVQIFKTLAEKIAEKSERAF